VKRAGFDILEEHSTGLPLGVVSEGSGNSLRAIRAIDKLLVSVRPQLFSYQYILRLTPHVESQLMVDVA
jgi:hypothetical protein